MMISLAQSRFQENTRNKNRRNKVAFTLSIVLTFFAVRSVLLNSFQGGLGSAGKANSRGRDFVRESSNISRMMEEIERTVARGARWYKDHSFEGKRCALGEKGACGMHGACSRNACVCAVLFAGSRSCDWMIDVPEMFVVAGGDEGEGEVIREKMIRVFNEKQKEERKNRGSDSKAEKKIVDSLEERGITFDGAITLNRETCGREGTSRVSALTVKLPSRRTDDDSDSASQSSSSIVGGFFKKGKRASDLKSGERGFVNVGTVEQTVLKRLAETDVVTPREEPWMTCAVVGKSGVLLSYENGPNIDQHEAIIRVDDLPTRGFEQSVGSRTTIRMCGDAKLPFCQKYVRESGEETLLVNITNGNSLRAFARMHRLHDNSVGAVTKKRLKLEALHPEFMEFVAEAIEGISPMTTEAQAIMFALLHCASVDVYGIGLGPNEGFSIRYDDELFSISTRGSKNSDNVISSNGVTTELEQIEGSFNLLKSLYNFGLGSIAERCIIECHASPDACVLCQTDLLHAVENDFR
jgi:hypothetical protein